MSSLLIRSSVSSSLLKSCIILTRPTLTVASKYQTQQPLAWKARHGAQMAFVREYGSKKNKSKSKGAPVVNDSKADQDSDVMLLDLEKTSERMDKVLDHFSKEFNSMRAGRANPAILDPIKVYIEDESMRLADLAMVSVKDAHNLLVIPHDNEMIKEIEKSIRDSGLGLNPLINNNAIKVPIPKTTKEARQKLVKEVSVMAETARVQIRKHRQDAMRKLKTDSKEGMSKDDVKRWEKAIQTKTDEKTKKVEDLLKAKVREIEQA
ncbi:hypothetical protein H4219_001200 [Mycoemilia scoparia]|uniref:Ribosome recycling factor domain-containing protein n=1 Tax=Mycoemilia scoparia TaxID=417184 RepID=A0A9W8AA61_9FUNG|nr:hypothetical protein H4219_001200 [Mycoemilia scoparia]